jgi:hypothetical protein
MPGSMYKAEPLLRINLKCKNKNFCACFSYVIGLYMNTSPFRVKVRRCSFRRKRELFSEILFRPIISLIQLVILVEIASLLFPFARSTHQVMGLLKHVLLPGFGLIHAASAAACYDLQGWANLVGLKDEVSEEDKTSLRQNHMVGVLRGFNLAMLTLCAMGIFKHAHFRGQIVFAEFVLYATATVDAFRLGGLNYFVPGAHALVALGGFIVNTMEPGIFTKDKSI